MLASVCMIVWNEKTMLPQAVESARALADEFVIVDTGSTDGTVALAEALGARVITGADRMHKGAARNMALNAADGDWCVVLDADETIADPVAVRTYLENAPNSARALYIKMRAGDTSWAQMRVWRTDSFHYKYRAHEVPIPTNGNWRGVVYTDLVWDHHQPSNRWAWKLPYTLDRLKLDVAENPGDGRPLYYLGRQYVYLHQYEDGLQTLGEYLAVSPTGIDASDAHRHRAECYKQLDRPWEQKRELWLATMVDPLRRENWGTLAELYYHDQDNLQALALLKAALEIPPPRETYIAESWYGPHPHDLTARTLWRLGRYEEGRAYAQEAVRLAPEDARLRKNLWWFDQKTGGNGHA